MVQANLLYLNVVSVDGSIFSGEVFSLQVTGQQGELGIYPGHAPLLTSIIPGLVKLSCDLSIGWNCRSTSSNSDHFGRCCDSW